MKINQKTTNYVISAALVYLILVGFVGFFKIFKPFGLPLIPRYILNFIIEGAYLIVIIYLSYFLKYLNEKGSIILTFHIYIGFDLLAFLFRLFVRSPISGSHLLISTIIFAVVIYFIIQIFRIKNPVLAPYFKLLAATMLFSKLFISIGTIFLVQHYVGRSILTYIVLAELLPPVIIILILYKTSMYLNKQQYLLKQTTANADGPA
jgi:hypothetical protein